jgi:hypothetical protein
MTALYLQSEPGDQVGQGKNYSYTSPQTSFTVSATLTAINVTVASSPVPWVLHLIPPSGTQFTNAIYEGAQRTYLNASGVAGIDVNASAIGCNPVAGRFELSNVQTDGNGNLVSFVLQFEQHCDGWQPPLFGQMLYNTGAAAAPAVSVAGAQVLKGNAGTSDGQVVVSLSQPLAATSSVTLATADGTAHARTDYIPTRVRVRFPAGVTSNTLSVPIVGNTIATGDRDFTVKLSSPLGVPLGYGTADISIADVNSPQTVLAMTSQPDDFVGSGRAWLETGAYASIEPQFTRGGVILQVNSPEFWNLDFQAPVGKSLVVRDYEHAQRFPGHNIPGLSVTGNSHGCDNVAGNFQVGALTVPTTLAVDFEQFCDSNTTALFGSLRINSMLQQLSVTNAMISGDTATFEVTVNPPATVPVYAYFNTIRGTAAPRRDYKTVSKLVTIPAGSGMATVIVPLLPNARHGRIFYGQITSPDTPPVWIETGSARL